VVLVAESKSNVTVASKKMRAVFLGKLKLVFIALIVSLAAKQKASGREGWKKCTHAVKPFFDVEGRPEPARRCGYRPIIFGMFQERPKPAVSAAECVASG
jgi:hypothetical protein